MITPIQEKLIKELVKNGFSQRQAAKQLHISRNTVGDVMAKRETRIPVSRESKYESYIQQIRELFARCKGNVVRVREELVACHNIEIPYQSLTWLIRKHQIRIPAPERAGRYHFAPGEDMQHDTSPHRLQLGSQTITAQCASLVLSYSRRLFVQYYPRFTRFECKVFLDAALQYMQGSCKLCVIDNTSVIVGRGSGPNAEMAPEMEMFGRIYGFTFMAHRINHADRKARVERPFHYIENNFLAGRTFRNWQDLNQQAIQWCDQVSNPKPKQSLGMSPDEAFIMEKPSLIPLPKVSPPVYIACLRTVDVEGYIHLDTNRYSVPDNLIGCNLEVLKHWDRVEMYHGRKLAATHERVLQGRNKRITTPGHHKPLNRKHAYQGPCIEEKTLTGQDDTLDQYVAGLKKRSRGRGVIKLRRLLEFQRTYPEEPFLKAVKVALHYKLFDLTRLEKMIVNNTGGDYFNLK